jgi:hypothetical protein
VTSARGLPGYIIGLIVVGCAVLLGLVCLLIWLRKRSIRRRFAKLDEHMSSHDAMPTHTPPLVAARGSAKCLAAARRDALSPIESAETPISPALGADAYVGLLVAEVRRVQAEYGSNAPPAYVAAAGVDANADAGASRYRAEPEETAPVLPQRLTGATRKTRGR